MLLFIFLIDIIFARNRLLYIVLILLYFYPTNEFDIGLRKGINPAAKLSDVLEALPHHCASLSMF